MAVATPSFAPDARRTAHMSVRLARKAGGWEQSGEFAGGDTETGHGNVSKGCESSQLTVARFRAPADILCESEGIGSVAWSNRGAETLA